MKLTDKKQLNTSVPSQLELANKMGLTPIIEDLFVAGLFDGRGNVFVRKRDRKPRGKQRKTRGSKSYQEFEARLWVQHTDEAMLKRVQDNWGDGRIRKTTYKKGGKKYYSFVLTASKQDAVLALAKKMILLVWSDEMRGKLNKVIVEIEDWQKLRNGDSSEANISVAATAGASPKELADLG